MSTRLFLCTALALSACEPSEPPAHELEQSLSGLTATAAATPPVCASRIAANVDLSGSLTTSGSTSPATITLAVDGSAPSPVVTIPEASFAASGRNKVASYTLTVVVPNGTHSLVLCFAQPGGKSACAAALPVNVQCLCTGVVCDDANACTNDFCDQATGVCKHIDVSRCATPSCGLGACAGPDSDGDGLSDAWETQGYVDNNCNGVNDGSSVDLPLPNADPNVKNIYVEYDYMADATHTHAPQAASIQLVIDSFARRGIVLTIDPLHDQLAEHAVITLTPVPVTNPACVGSDAIDFFDVKRAHFDPRRKGVYHYAVFGHYAQCPPGPDGGEDFCNNCVFGDRGQGHPKAGSTGSSEVAGNDFVVTTGDQLFDELGQGGIFMHELGHNFGLRHGGNDEVLFKPNYLSVMNYSYQFSGVPTGPAGALFPTGALLDYSGEVLLALDERVLDENLGAGAASTGSFVRWFPPSGPPKLAAGPGPIDWNRNGVLESATAVDLNRDGQLSTLTGFNDWASLQLQFQCTPWGSQD